MPELQPVRGVIVEDCQEKFDALNAAFQEAGGQLVAWATSYDAAIELINNRVLSPQKTDVAFIDADLGLRRSEGRQLHLQLCQLGHIATSPQTPDPRSIVTVGASSVPYMAQEIGTPAIQDGQPLIVEWEYVPLVAVNLPEILQEVRLLKPALS
ncbi:MAG: hypothetical protein QG553_253 [Patescibacteria group bacterium]|nr:hypothetical protein [Patescibacteria group bacterium]